MYDLLNNRFRRCTVYVVVRSSTRTRSLEKFPRWITLICTAALVIASSRLLSSSFQRWSAWISSREKQTGSFDRIIGIAHRRFSGSRTSVKKDGERDNIVEKNKEKLIIVDVNGCNCYDGNAAGMLLFRQPCIVYYMLISLRIYQRRIVIDIDYRLFLRVSYIHL